MSFCVAGVIFGEVGGSAVSPRIARDVSYVSRTNHACHSVFGEVGG